LGQKQSKLKAQAKVQLLKQLQSGTLSKLQKQVMDQQARFNEYQLPVFEKQSKELKSAVAGDIEQLIPYVTIRIFENDLNNPAYKYQQTSYYKNYITLFSGKKLRTSGIPYSVKFKKAVQHSVPLNTWKILTGLFDEFGRANIQYIFDFQKILFYINDSFSYLQKNIDADDLSVLAEEGKNKILEQVEEFEGKIKKNQLNLKSSFAKENIKLIEQTGAMLSNIPANPSIKTTPDKLVANKEDLYRSVQKKWVHNQKILLNALFFELKLMLVEIEMGNLFNETSREINKVLEGQIIQKIETFYKQIESLHNSPNPENKKLQLENALVDEKYIQLSINKINDLDGVNFIKLYVG
jgi:hypothetical protein